MKNIFYWEEINGINGRLTTLSFLGTFTVSVGGGDEGEGFGLGGLSPPPLKKYKTIKTLTVINFDLNEIYPSITALYPYTLIN